MRITRLRKGWVEIKASAMLYCIMTTMLSKHFYLILACMFLVLMAHAQGSTVDPKQAEHAGIVYTLKLTESATWQPGQTLFSDLSKANSFGQAVSVDGDTLVVGNPFDQGTFGQGTGAEWYRGRLHL